MLVLSSAITYCTPGWTDPISPEGCECAKPAKGGIAPSLILIPKSWDPTVTKIDKDPATESYGEIVNIEIPVDANGDPQLAFALPIVEDSGSLTVACTENDNGSSTIQGDLPFQLKASAEFLAFVECNKCAVFQVLQCKNTGDWISACLRLNSWTFTTGADPTADTCAIDVTFTNDNKYSDSLSFIDPTKGITGLTAEELIEDLQGL